MYRTVSPGFLVISVCKLVSVCSEDTGSMPSNESMKWLIHMPPAHGCTRSLRGWPIFALAYSTRIPPLSTAGRCLLFCSAESAWVEHRISWNSTKATGWPAFIWYFSFENPGYLDSSCDSSSSVHEGPRFAINRVEHGGLLPGAGGGRGTMPWNRRKLVKSLNLGLK